MIADKSPATPLSEPEMASFLDQFLELYIVSLPIEGDLQSYDVAWWVRFQDESRKRSCCKLVYRHSMAVCDLFSNIHLKVSRSIVFHRTPLTTSNSIFPVQFLSKMSSCLQVHQDGDPQGA